MRGALVLFLTLYLLQALVAVANHAISGLHLHLFVAGLFVTYGALMLPLGSGLPATLFAGFFCDATAPVLFGTHALLFAAAHVILYRLRSRLPREDTEARVLVALIVNLAVFLLLTLIVLRSGAARPAAWGRLAADLIASQVVLGLFGPWFFALQAQSLRLARVELA